MIPRLTFQEWEGLQPIAGQVSETMRAASRAWPYFIAWTLSDIKTAAWLVDNNHLTRLERVVFTSDLDTSTVSREVDTITQIAEKSLSLFEDQVLVPPTG